MQTSYATVEHHPTRDLKRDWRPGDARKLAQLFNESGPGWPGGFGHDDTTPEQAERDVRESDLLAVFVAEADDRIVAYCNLGARRGERSAYVPLLNAHPNYHGGGFGKAVLLSCVERAVELGYDRVLLGTWPGNFKAVPLYKKAGFMWAPETDVSMESFVPSALRHPLARPYFENHNWYETQVRDLSLHEDVFKRGKVRTYEYLWRADGDMLRMVFDRQSWGPLEIETNDLRAGCFLPDEKIIADMPQQIRWEIECKTGRPLDVVIVTQPESGITCAWQESLAVRRRETRSAEFIVDPEIAEKQREPYAHIIRSTLLIDGQPLELAAGMEVRQAATVRAEPDFTPLRPGVEQRLFLRIASNLDQRSRASVAISCARGGRMKRHTAALELKPHGCRRFGIALAPARAGQVDLNARASLKIGRRTVRAKDSHIAVRALGAGNVVGSVDEWRAVLENAKLRVSADRGGYVQVLLRRGVGARRPFKRMMTLRTPVVGPPYAWEEFFTRPRLDAVIERDEGGAVAVLRSDSAQRPGLLLERRIRLTEGPIIELRDTIVNTTAITHDLTLSRDAWPGDLDGAMAMPAPGRIVETPMAGAALDLRDFQPLEDAAQWPEAWLFGGSRGGEGIGLIWRGATRVEYRWGVSIKQPVGRLAPGASAQAPPYFVFAGHGGPEVVRSWWQSLCAADGGTDTAAAGAASPSSPIAFGLRPSPLVASRGGADARVFVNSTGRRRLTGRLRLEMPAGVRVSGGSHKIDGVDGSRTFEAPVRVTCAPRAKAGMRVGRAGLMLEEAVLTRDVPILISDADTEIEEQREGAILAVSAPPLHLRADPAFCGCAVSLQWQKREMLHTSHPDHPPFMWWNPWFGGIWPQVGGMWELLWKERFSGRFVARAGVSGVAWRGIGVSCSPRHERGRHVRIGLECLLLPGAPVCAIAVTCSNRTEAVSEFDVGADIWLALGGKPTDKVRVYRAGETEAVRRRTDNSAYVHFGRWGIVENPGRRSAVLLASDGSDGARAGVDLTGHDGYHLRLRCEGLLEPRARSQALFYLAFGESAEQVRPYEHLAGCARLP